MDWLLPSVGLQLGAGLGNPTAIFGPWGGSVSLGPLGRVTVLCRWPLAPLGTCIHLSAPCGTSASYLPRAGRLPLLFCLRHCVALAVPWGWAAVCVIVCPAVTWHPGLGTATSPSSAWGQTRCRATCCPFPSRCRSPSFCTPVARCAGISARHTDSGPPQEPSRAQSRTPIPGAFPSPAVGQGSAGSRRELRLWAGPGASPPGAVSWKPSAGRREPPSQGHTRRWPRGDATGGPSQHVGTARHRRDAALLVRRLLVPFLPAFQSCLVGVELSPARFHVAAPHPAQGWVLLWSEVVPAGRTWVHPPQP
ncbi:transcription factor AP-4 isoform X3 [Lagopus leucura]|uniref:transcription factor AP-4 isoform X3 n=1 Tax=Lagopus leucura TaxID=30410 RepID=UPI001C666991|nr:transcription factor AP-4 isoform X3 [Lagopus leucura]